MADPPKPATVAKMALTADRAQERIRKIAIKSCDVILTDHALIRMGQRGITDIEVHRILRTGFVEEAPIDLENGEWKCKVVKKVQSGREVGVVTIIMTKGQLLVKTVEWEDGR